MKTKKNFIFSALFALGLVGVISVSLASLNTRSSANNVVASKEDYTLILNSESNRLGDVYSPSGEANHTTLLTNAGNSIGFTYQGLTHKENVWDELLNGGEFHNSDAISGIQSINMVASVGQLRFEWSGAADFSNSSIDDRMITALDESISFDFDGDVPNYFRIINTGGSSISIDSITIHYSCFDEYVNVRAISENSTMGSVEGGGYFLPSTAISLTATPNSGYHVVGFFVGENLVSNTNTYTLNVPNEDITIVVKFAANDYIVSVHTVDASDGSIDSLIGSVECIKGKLTAIGEYFAYQESVSLDAVPYSEQSVFVGWYDESDNLLSENLKYTFNMPAHSVNLRAKFRYIKYSLTVVSEDVEKGTVVGSGNYECNKDTTVVAIPNTGYGFKQWVDSNNMVVSSDATYTFTMPAYDYTLTAEFEMLRYRVGVSVNNVSAGSAFVQTLDEPRFFYMADVQVVATLTDPSTYAFVGWHDGIQIVSTESIYNFTMPAHDLNLEARFERIYQITVDYHPTIGSLEMGYYAGECAVAATTTYDLTAYANAGYVFAGWYNSSLELITAESEITGVMPNNDLTLYMAFKVEPPSKGSIVEFGLYPQTKLDETSDASLIAALNETAGVDAVSLANNWTTYEYYVSSSLAEISYFIDIEHSDGYKYRGVYFVQYRPYYTGTNSNPGSTSQDENSYQRNVAYWFKYEPIEWVVLDVVSSDVLLMSNIIIDSNQVSHYPERTSGDLTIYPSNYEYSDIRTFLNNSFYNTAFNSDEKNLIYTSVVDNSLSTTYGTEETYTCGTTNDKVFLASYKDVVNESYGFDSNSSRTKQGSDYAKSQGLKIISDNGQWWTRSPYSNKTYYVDNNGFTMNNKMSDYTDIGVVPCIKVAF